MTQAFSITQLEDKIEQLEKELSETKKQLDSVTESSSLKDESYDIRISQQDWLDGLDVLDEIVTLHSFDKKVFWANRKAFESFKEIYETPVGRYCHELYSGQDTPCNHCLLSTSDKYRKRHKTILTNKQSRRVYKVNSTLFPSEGKSEPYMLHIARDISSDVSKDIDQIIEESDDRFTKYFESNPVAMVISEIETGVLVDMNQRFWNMLGYTKEELLGVNARNLYHTPGDRDRLVETFLRDNSLSEYPVNLTTKDGCLRSTLWSVEKISIRGRTLMLSLIRDITKILKQNEELERLAAAIEQTNDAVIITDAEGSIEYVNIAFEAVSGYSREEVLGKNPRILKSGEHGEDFYRKFWETLADRKIYKGRIVNKKKGGELYTEEVSVSPICDKNGSIVKYVAVKRDISAQLLLEAQYHQAQKMEAVGRLTGGVAHDFNNILSVIIGYAEMALDKMSPSHHLHGDLLKILEAGERSAQIIKQLLAFSRKQTISPKVVDLNQAVESTLRMIKRLIGENIEVTWVPGEGENLITIDLAQVDQVLANLCINSKDAIEGAGTMTIETDQVVIDELYCKNHPGFREGRFIQLSVSDDGCGIPRNDLDKVFEPFFTTKGMERGTGLGLSTVYGIMKQNGGFINIYSEVGLGTTIRLYFPQCIKGERLAVPSTSAFNRRGRGETILLVEDDKPILVLAERILLNLGYKVLPANTAEGAIEIAINHEGRIDLLLTDVVMPQMNGKDLAEKLSETIPELRVLFMSGYSANAIAHDCILDEGINFIQKPFSMADLTLMLDKVLGPETHF